MSNAKITFFSSLVFESLAIWRTQRRRVLVHSNEQVSELAILKAGKPHAAAWS